ncbi:cytochrome b/b6 domain-containing protein [Pseudomonas sp. R2.Fl]|nr:cytochrome b/b6 domain-containing protein [Pseudomonas sp. R2.Fl]
MASTAPLGYSVLQKALHWLMVLLIFFNLFFAEGMEKANRAFETGQTPTPDDLFLANLHVYAGIAVLCLGILRLVMRLVKGAPEAPAAEPPIFQLAAKVAHGTFYLLFFLLPLTGIGKYYFGNDAAGFVHAGPLKLLMWVLIVVHVLALVVHQFYWKTDVARRMTGGVR